MIRIPVAPVVGTPFDRWCTRHGLSNDDIADALKVSRVTVWKWRAGQHPFNRMTWIALVALITDGVGLTTKPIPPVGSGAFDQWMRDNAFTNETLAVALEVSRATVWKWRSERHPVEWITWVACNVVTGDAEDKKKRQRAAKSIEDAKQQASQIVKQARQRALANA